MKLGDVGVQALLNLRRHKVRTGLTVTGVAIGVATLTVMVSLGTGLERLVTSQFDQAELVSRITVYPEGTLSSLFRPGRAMDPPRPLTDADVAVLGSLTGIQAAFPDVHTLVGAELGNALTAVESEGLPAAALAPGYTSSLLAGSYWTPSMGDVCVLPSRLLSELGLARAQDALGLRITFVAWESVFLYRDPGGSGDGRSGGDLKSGGDRSGSGRLERPPGARVREVQVVGVYDSEKLGLVGERIHVPLALGTDLLYDFGPQGFGFAGRLERGQYRAAVVKVASVRDVDSVREQIKARRYDSLSVYDYLIGIKVVFAVFEVLLGFFGGIGLFVAFFGIVNTMVMAVLERTREIGVLKALGARNRDIRRLFFTEASAIGLGGGSLGVLAGWTLGLALNGLATYLLADKLSGTALELFYVPMWLAGAAVGLSTFVAMLAGLYPAWRAARLDPVVALRTE